MTLDEFTKGINIVKVISGYTGLKKIGKNYWGLCPFHEEKSASFYVDAEQQRYNCFSCKACGNVVDFVMNIEGVEQEESVRLLSQRAGIPTPQLTDNQERESTAYKERLLAANKEAARFFHELLYKPEGAKVLEYLRKRGLTDDVIRKFGLGAAPDQWSVLSNYLISKGYKLEELEAAGLTLIRPPKNPGEKRRYFDMFRNRAIFPIIDREKNVIAFGGRSIDGQEPKYLNSADTPVYNKRKHVYAENLLPGKRLERVILVEGYMDVVSLTQFGVKGVCATLGTALTNEQARLISQYAPEIHLGYDGDSAGQHAILRGLDIMEEEKIPVRVLDFPDGLDPDEFVRRDGAYGFRSLPAIPPTTYRLRRLKSSFDLTKREERQKYLRGAAEILSELDPISKEIYTRSLAEETHTPRERVQQLIEGGKSND